MNKDSPRTEPLVTGQCIQQDGIDLQLRIELDNAYLQGHFPAVAIVPGVAQVDWAVLFADRYLGTDLRAAVDFRVKFRSVILPPADLILELRFEGASPASRRLGFAYRNGDVIYSSGAIRLEREQ